MESGIYLIQSTLDKNKSYVGSTANLFRRKKEHWIELKNNKHFNNKIQNYYNKHGAMSLEFNIIEMCDESDLILREQYYIDKMKPYFNIRPLAHSNKGIKLSDETRKRMSDAHKKLFINGMIQWNKGIPNSDEQKRKISEANKGMQNMKGKHHSDATKLKMAISRTGSKRNPETRKKMSDAQKGKIFSNEHKRNLSLSKIGNKYSLGRKLSEETKKKIIETRKTNKLKK